MESEQRGRASRASSTSSLGREVRCGCQYYQSDSLLPERTALIGRPPSRSTMQQPAGRCSEHEYEPISPRPRTPQLQHPPAAPVVRITETDVGPVADSDDSVDERDRFSPRIGLEADIVLPLDGKIEDSAMEGRELVANVDTSEEQELTAQQFQQKVEERFFNPATPGAESRTGGEVNTSQVDSTTAAEAVEESPLQRGARGLPERIKTQAGKLRSRLRGIQRPSFAFADRRKPEKSRSTSSGRSEKSRTEERPSRMERLRSSLPERPKFNLPDRPRFNIKRPNIRLPSALTRSKKPPSLREQQRQRSTESTVGSKRNIFDFSTYPRIFDKKSKQRTEYATSSPKDSRAQSTESATYPRTKKALPLSARWAQRFGDTFNLGEDPAISASERAHPWRHPSLEEPRLSIRMEEEVIMAVRTIPWEEGRKVREAHDDEDEIQYMDYEQGSREFPVKLTRQRSEEIMKTEGESFEQESPQLDPRLYDDRATANIVYTRGSRDDEEEINHVKWQPEETEEIRKIPRSRSLEHQISVEREEIYERSFQPVDPRRFGSELQSEEEEELDEEEEEELDVSSALSDKEQQQSSGSSCDRRRRGVIEEIDSDEFFLRESGISQDDMTVGKYLANEIRDALRAKAGNVLADEEYMPTPPQRPARTRSFRKRKEDSVESCDLPPPERPKRERGRSRRSEGSADDVFLEARRNSMSKHRIVYQAESVERESSPREPLDDIVVVKPIRRKSRSSLRSQSQAPTESSVLPSSLTVETSPTPPPAVAPPPPTAPSRRKRPRRENAIEQRNGTKAAMCNGHREWTEISDTAPEKPLPPPPSMETEPLERDAAQTTVHSARDVAQEHLRDLEEQDYIEPAPIPPKRKSRSRGTSVAPDEDRTSRGAESLPEVSFEQEDLPRDEAETVRDQTGYAIVEKREKPPRPPPPRRRHKFATTPRSAPKRPQRAYSTLGPPIKAESAKNILQQDIETAEVRQLSAPYMEIDADDMEQKDLRSGEVLIKMQGRPLPAPPRPPRPRKQKVPEDVQPHERATEIAIATQTDPLPDDVVIEEEITQAKLIVAPSRSGSQILVSTERIPSPSGMSTPPVPPFPSSQHLCRDEDVGSEKATSSVREDIFTEEKEERSRLADDPILRADDLSSRLLRSALLSDEPLRISSLEVGDLRVDRLCVSQLEAHKIAASEIDTMVISASELKSATGTIDPSQLPSSLLRELIAIRSHLETVATNQEKEHPSEEKVSSDVAKPVVVECPATPDIPREEKRESDSRAELSKPSAEEDGKSEPRGEDATKHEVLAEKDDRTVSATQPLVPAARSVQDTSSLQLLHLDPSPRMEISIEASRVSVPPSEVPLARSSSWESFPRSTGVSSETTTVAVDESKDTEKETDSEQTEQRDDTESRSRSKSRSRSSSPSGRGLKCAVRQTASPVKSLPPVISVTPDTPDAAKLTDPIVTKPQRAVISYSHESERTQRDRGSPSPPPRYPMSEARFIAFPASQIPPEFFSLAASPNQQLQQDPSVMETTQQLLRALRNAGIRAMRYFVGYVASRVNSDASTDKIREVELALCALLLLVAGLLILCFGSPRTITHYHHWDYFNPPQ